MTGDSDKANEVSADMASLITTIKSEGVAYRREEAREDRGKKFREWITIGLLGCTLIAVGWQVHEMIKVYGPIKDQAHAAQEAANAGKVASEAATVQSKNSDKALVESQRAWAGPSGGKLDAAVVENTDMNIQINVQNTGREPALNFTYFIAPFLASVADDRSGKVAQSINAFVHSCRATPSRPNAQVLYPTLGFGEGFKFTSTVNKKFVDKKVIDGSAIVLVPGCLIYDTFQKTRHSTFCFFYKGGVTKPDNLNLCVNGSTAD